MKTRYQTVAFYESGGWKYQRVCFVERPDNVQYRECLPREGNVMRPALSYARLGCAFR
jgi:hypothetical protein